MIQRIQSVFFLLAAGSFGALFGLPIATSTTPASPYLEDGVFNILDQPSLIALSVLGAALALVAIFLYKNRTLQVRIGFAVIAAALLLIGLSYWLYSGLASAQGESAGLTISPGLYLPAGAVLFGWLATRFVRKDERIVRSMDRLR